MFITDYPAMLIEGRVIISDVHLGISRELFRAGVKLPNQARRLAEKANRLHRLTKSDSLVIVGDVKHRIPVATFGESREVLEFFSLLDFKNVTIVKGNHDGNIEDVVGGLKNVRVKKSVVLGNCFLTHGHRNISTVKKTVVIGHNHPNVKLVDKMGASYVMPCWVIGRMDAHRLIIMPSFNELSGTMVVNDKKYERFNGPVARAMKKDAAKVYLLDGTSLGTIKDLMVE